MEHPLIIQMRRVLLKGNGGNAFKGLRKVFRDFDDNSDMTLCREEVTTGLKEFGVLLAPEEWAELFAAFDANGDGTVCIGEFMGAVKGTMPETRRGLVDHVFQALVDVAGTPSGQLELERMLERNDPSRHPFVISGAKTQQQILKDLTTAFTTKTCRDRGYVCPQEFMDYYHAMSVNIDEDEVFDSILANTWNFGELPKKHGVRLEPARTDHPLAKAKQNYNPSEADVFFESKRVYDKPPAPRRVVGFTGHIVGTQESCGQTFQTLDRIAAAQEALMVKHRPPAAEYPDNVEQDLRPRLALNRTTFKLE